MQTGRDEKTLLRVGTHRRSRINADLPRKKILSDGTKVFKWWDYLCFTALSCLGISAIVYFLINWLTLKDWESYPITLAILTLMFGVILLNNQARWFLLPLMKKPRPTPARPGWNVGVVTTFVNSAESMEMLEETVRALTALDYAHDTWVLDEGDDETIKALCQKLGAHHFSRKDRPEYQTQTGPFQSRSKHGNYNAWLSEIGYDRYDIICAFDPDHVPQPSFLSHVLGYFNEAAVGYVQAPQAYYNQQSSFIARGAAEETYAYYSSIQMASYGLGYPIIIGCHNTHRTSALKQVGGFPAHDADDLLITRLYRSYGWQGVYVPKILARGLTPVDWNGYLMQQRRWARSILDLKIRSYPKYYGKLPMKTRVISVLHGLNYLHKSLLIPMGLLLLASMLLTGSAPDIFSGSMAFGAGLVIMSSQLCELYRQRFYLDRKTEWGCHWRVALLQFAKWPYLLLALFDVLIDRRLPYVLTPKVKSGLKPRQMMWPQFMVVGAMTAAVVIGSISGRSLPIFVYLCAAAVILLSLILILTEGQKFPDPYPGKASAP